MTPEESLAAGKLVAGAQVFAINSRDGFSAQYPTLGRLSSDEWNELLTIAGCGTALLMLPGRYTADQQRELTATVVLAVREWDEKSVQSLAGFINFVTQGAKDHNDLPDRIGGWVVRNHGLAPNEGSAPHVIGLMLVNTFAPWWDQ